MSLVQQFARYRIEQENAADVLSCSIASVFTEEELLAAKVISDTGESLRTEGLLHIAISAVVNPKT